MLNKPVTFSHSGQFPPCLHYITQRKFQISSNSTFSFRIAVFSSPPLPDNVFEGDIELTREQLMNIDIYGDIRGNVSRAAGSNSRIRWPNAIIPYEIDCSLRKCEFLYSVVISFDFLFETFKNFRIEV